MTASRLWELFVVRGARDQADMLALLGFAERVGLMCSNHHFVGPNQEKCSECGVAVEPYEEEGP